MSDVNIEYNKSEKKIILNAYNKHFPKKKVKVNKHWHKLSEWITTGIIKSIEHRDRMYKHLKMLPADSMEQQQMRLSLKTFSSYLNTKIGDIISTPLGLIINHSLCSGFFASKLKLA